MTDIEQARRRAESEAESRGYCLNPDASFLRDLLDGLVENERRYGYPSCPCRIATGNFDLDRDIICPCDYRDQDVEEFGACYCALYVRKDVYEGKSALRPVPERRPVQKQLAAISAMGRAEGAQQDAESGLGPKVGSMTDPGSRAANASRFGEVIGKMDGNGSMEKATPGGSRGMKLWYCKQCGYVAYREEPPYMCPICKAKKEFFAELKIGLSG
ncbi:MAG: ferredoxin-thioredoxin reductase catalytic domain-containing protein [Candidatus Verstraetearchaeota archaeon]|nr:ferredoxin-thioredoxin reductase catalytic domain-containing protein [Candidatus Verstraetearchaeota archaeon]